LRLAEKYSGDIERVAERALSYGATRYRSIKTMLENGISDEQPTHRAPLSDLGQRFLREPSYFAREVHHD
jgi:DNA-binding ferritin-like protein